MPSKQQPPSSAGGPPLPSVTLPAAQIVSVIVPCRNEVDHIECFVQSLMTQCLPSRMALEVLIADGRSDDGTREELDRLSRQNPSIQIVDNPKRTAAAGLNAAIRRARGEIFIRMDVHTTYAADYIFQCLHALQTSAADNVGGPWVARGSGYVSKAIALAFSSLLVSGGGKAHCPAYEGPVDTVYLGCWPRKAFETFGLFDEEFIRTQDSELNLRINRAGGTVWQTPAIRSWYIPRSSLRQLAGQYTQYGYWKAKVLQKHKRLASSRQWAPGGILAVLLLLILLSPFLAWARFAAAALVTIYTAALAVGSVPMCGAHGRWRLLPIMPVVIGVYHFSFGYGFLRGFFDFVVRQKAGDEKLRALTRTARTQVQLHKSSVRAGGAAQSGRFES